MKATELMINDIVGSRFHAQPMRYSGIFTNYEPLNEKPYTRLRLMLNENEGLDVPECDVVPIPLTKEQLEKNGFIDDGFMIRTANGKCIKVCLMQDMPMFVKAELSYCFPRPLFVHELQHALRLVGLNDIADNFKIE